MDHEIKKIFYSTNQTNQKFVHPSVAKNNLNFVKVNQNNIHKIF